MFEIERFLVAQEQIFPQVLAELLEGHKQTHWMWYIFPQLRGLGHSSMSQRFGIASLEEARTYLAHPLLGPRLVQCVNAVLAVHSSSLVEIFGYPDDMKFRSSMTLFAIAEQDSCLFQSALGRYCSNVADPVTLRLLGFEVSYLSHPGCHPRPHRSQCLPPRT